MLRLRSAQEWNNLINHAPVCKIFTWLFHLFILFVFIGHASTALSTGMEHLRKIILLCAKFLHGRFICLNYLFFKGQMERPNSSYPCVEFLYMGVSSLCIS